MEQDLKMYNILKERLIKKEDYHKLDMINQRIEYASKLLDLVRDTFPTYTLHNTVHCVNIIKKMEMLIGDYIENLSDMELSLLILSAYYHDIGMVYDSDFKENLATHPMFQTFLEANPDIAISYYETLLIDDEITESFCRIYHAQNSYDHIVNMSDDLFFWNNNISLKNSLALLCKSHGENIEILNSGEFDTDYMYEADLRFCSIMLRLGDVLDFDYSRTPCEIYNYLKLYRKRTAQQETSDREWQKHLSVNGLVCSSDRSIWNIVAIPKTPKTAHDLFEFLKYIESELSAASHMLKTCSAAKQTIKFPLHIDRSKIHNKDFIYGDYKFSISNDNLLHLFMGKNLYLDKYTFIRELIQNAIDTTSQRHIIETDLTENEIKISTYIDEDFDAFFCVEDFGMGMDLDIIQNYLLKVGSSYYESNRFKAFMAKKHKKMTSISKFGIGILSCFLISDEVKIYTRYYNSPTTYEIILDGINGFFAIKEVPVSNQNYLEHFGTKVLVNISSEKEDLDFNYENYINKITLYSKIKITFNGKYIEQNNDVVDIAWGNYEEIDLIPYKEHLLRSFNKTNVSVGKMQLKIYPLDLTKYSNNKNLRGEGIIFQLDIENIEELLKQENSDYERRLLGIKFDFGKIALYYSYDIDFSKIEKDLKNILYQINKINQELADEDECKLDYYVNDSNIIEVYKSKNEKFMDLCKEYYKIYNMSREYSLQKRGGKNEYIYFFNNEVRNAFSKTLRKEGGTLAHNGILIKQSECQCTTTTYLVMMCLALEDDLRPVLGLSRGELVSQSWEFYVAYYYAIINSVKEYCFNIENIHIPFEKLALDNWEYRYLNKAFINNIGDWKKIPIFYYNDKPISVMHLPINKYIQMPLLDLKAYYQKNKFLDIARAILMQMFYNITLDITTGKVLLKRQSEDLTHEKLNQSVFPPLFFVSYINGHILKKHSYPLNEQHPFSQWLIRNSNYLNDNYNQLFYKILQVLMDDSISLRARKITKILERIMQIDQNNCLRDIPPIKDADFL